MGELTDSDRELREMRLLLVDDEPVNIRLLRSVLEANGYTQLQSTTDGRQAGALVEQFRPDLILLDLMMPGMDGYAVLDQVRREQARGAFLPIMILTADPSESAKQRALKAGATDFLIKPFERTECILRIQNLLTTRRLHIALARENDLLEARVRQRTAALESALIELRSAQQQLVQRERLGALGSMVTGIAHDFNNTLALIVGQGERLQSECRRVGASREISDCAQTIVSAALEAAETVGRLRDFHRPAKPGEVHVPLQLPDIAREAIHFAKPRWQAESRGRGAPIDCVTEFGSTEPIAGHATELREMLSNLIFNAIDAMPQGGTILIRTRTAADRVILEFRDSGTGMTEAVKRRCLEPFFTTKAERGSGLGLAMVYGTVERHHGTVRIDSIPGHGTTFTFSFPADRSGTVPSPAKAASKGKPLRVLVVDDQPVLTEILAETLSRDWHTVTTALNGRDAFDKFEREDFDLVITDKAMPEMNGDQLAAAIKARAPEMPIIMLTGFADLEDKREEVSEFVDHVLIKPATNAELRAAITAVLRAA